MGYSTQLGQGGNSISGGQRQRIAVARALANKPSILLLDEATSNLDAITERKIHQELDRLRCTRIVIAHRLSTIRSADKIAVLEGGRVVEIGSYEELVTRDGCFARLIAAQREPAAATLPSAANSPVALKPSRRHRNIFGMD
jgi:ABC-type bacteriocin/lantibiotic exporter with double-glycine peptidase domain